MLHTESPVPAGGGRPSPALHGFPAATHHEPAASAHPQIRHLVEAFNAVGGIASGEEVSILLRRHCDQPLSKLARWIVGGDIVSIEWRGQTLIPLFQFDLDEMAVKPEVTALLGALAGWRDGLRTGQWLVTPNALLNDQKPLECLAGDLPAVLQAAQAEMHSAAC